MIGRLYKKKWLLLAILSLTTTLFVALPSAAAEPNDQPPTEQGESFLLWVARCSGLIGVFIFMLSIYFVATVVRLFIEIRVREAAPSDLVRDFNALMQQRDFRSAYQVVKDSHSFFGRIMSVGVSELSNGIQEAREAMDRASEAVTIEMEKKISILAVLGTLGPMIGLLGTLKGMIASFSVIAMSDVQIKANQVAGGISEALLLTFEGVALSVPAIYFFALFRNRIASISADISLLADQTLRKFYHAASKTPPPQPAISK